MADKKTGYKVRWRLIHGVYACLILGVSSIPGSGLPPATSLVSDKILHFGEFGLLGLLGGWAYFTEGRRLWLLVLFGLSFAGLDELWQSYVPGRVCDFADYIVDVAGYLVGVFVGVSLVKRLG